MSAYFLDVVCHYADQDSINSFNTTGILLTLNRTNRWLVLQRQHMVRIGVAWSNPLVAGVIKIVVFILQDRRFHVRPVMIPITNMKRS
jgi:hypothetical protein